MYSDLHKGFRREGAAECSPDVAAVGVPQGDELKMRKTKSDTIQSRNMSHLLEIDGE